MGLAGDEHSNAGEIDVRIGANLRACRMRGGFTSAELAACAGMAVAELDEIEAGRQRASASQLWALSRELGATAHDFMEGAADAADRRAPGG